jgi:gliding motility-associated-like protein
LYLSGNQLSTQIPVELGLLRNLKYLRLDHNLLSGSIPEELGDLTQLTELFLGNNELEGKIPDSFINLTELSALGLAFNKLSGKLPAFIQDFPLISLVINNNQFQDTAWVNIPPNFRGANINISNNDFSVLPLLTTTGIRDEKFMVQQNRFTFDDLLPNYHFFSNILIFGGIEPERYSPQKSFGEDTTLIFSIFENPTIHLDIDQSVENNQYRWFKDGHFILSGDRPFLDLNAVYVAASQYPGIYHCEVTNDDVPELTLTSGKYKIHLDFSNLRDIGTPEAFTPNGDGINDFFILPDLFYKNTFPNELIIYDRLGELVFSQKDYNNQWSGTDLNQQPLPNGTYYYSFTSDNSRESGLVTIIRNP